ncbi:MAG: MerR family transcriptional regulator [Candidatus Omnitrophica bacterium]|nr:MerR family transcriptional regulator [Candidatus Omnitrophota bacterium]
MKKINELRVFSITETANILKVHRTTIYFWLKKGWVKVKRDYRNLPVFTEQDIDKINLWRNTLKEDK